MAKSRRIRWRLLLALAGAGLLSGCYYYPYGYYGSYSWYNPYPNPYPYAAGNPYPPPQPPAGQPGPPYPLMPTAPPLNAPVERTPLPPATE